MTQTTDRFSDAHRQADRNDAKQAQKTQQDLSDAARDKRIKDGPPKRPEDPPHPWPKGFYRL